MKFRRTVPLEVRNRRFGRDARAAHWSMGDPYATAFYTAISAALTRGEHFFIETLRAYLPDAPAQLRGEVRKFIAQEAIHHREHDAFNDRTADSGYDIAPLQSAVELRLAPIRQKSMAVRLAATMALEHFTATIAHHLLSDPRHLAAADAETRALWRWHAIEEIEHKAVAYDCWTHLTRDWSPAKRWRLRALVMLLCTRNFMTDRTRGMLALLRQDGLHGPAVWARLASFCLVRPGMIRLIWQSWFGYFRPGFHPWAHDDFHLIAADKTALA